MSRSSRAEWAKRVERWRDSGLTSKEFGAETGVNPSTLLYWSSQLRTRGKDEGGSQRSARPKPSRCRVAAASKAKFVELSQAPVVTHTAPMLEVVLGGGEVVRVPVDFDEATLGRVVRALEAAR